MIQRRVFVTGQVQGVGFRASTARQAGSYSGIKGFVRNIPDGRVEAVFCGPETAVLELVAWCRSGPPLAQVLDLEVREEVVDFSLPAFDVLR